MSATRVDVEAYLSRIGFHDPLAADRATLSALIQHHAAAIPFENIEVLAGRVPALDLASHLNRTMADCILDLYRSAVDVGTQWGPDFAAIPAPGLVIIPSEEPFMSAASSTRAAARAGARTAALDGLGHWWMLQDPAQAASVLREFWATPT